ncbi:MAG TPA: ABC transporter ATP-binding protein [Polyangiaceae bacterium LLY-WYZ-15_(1-7)]|nr:ABC transporter ATP-binding protein [Polyangiaceae bacterium LLY-WYZ-15_(1-7)]HJL05532.1 ABC transporter ATP-binding protein [Polyangiaceae bacterium LLY-WYZ-15_(1-7)]HJL12522.1 ABC transporter ATP-binding protein [Polyangiaceae bacterium LLY-WYZ-15_(1-7)]HJL27703.1 ABC transporter ATP-binding protein [Polyangiaceae bacterium LLY-WYZ-15_(1-7)]
MEPLLEARGLVKRYDGRAVVDGLDLRVEAGRVLGLLGPNGAGKTTTLRMLYGFARPDAGAIRVTGRDFRAERTPLKRLIGVCTQDDTLDYDFTVRQNLTVYASYFRPKVEGLGARVDGLLAQFGLARWADASPHALSGGYKRRLLIARSIVHRPKVLFLDEPTTGLDPAARVEVWELVAALREEGMGVVLTTHYMDEAERLSDELLVLREGRAVARGTTDAVLGDLLGEHVLVVRRGDPAREAVAAALAERGVTTSSVLGDLQAPVTAAQLAELDAALPDARLQVRPPNLDDLFLQLAEGSDA